MFRISSDAACAAAIFALSALLAACGGGGSSLAPSTPVQEGATRPHRDHTRSWMSPDAKAGDLLYISDAGSADVYVYSYPRGQQVGTLTGFVLPEGECVDKSGDVFIADFSASHIFEYAHGGKSPIATLNDPGYKPVGCAVNRTTGDLAVANNETTASGQGNVALYKHAKGNPKAYYTDPNLAKTFFCGYDDAGNLFVDGIDFASKAAFAELPNGSTSFRNVKLDQPIQSPGGVQWDGKHFAVIDTIASVIYEFAIKGKKGTEVGSTPLVAAANVIQFWIQQSKVVGPESSGADAGIWDYPSGGAVKKTIGGLDDPQAATISASQK